jgi:hypothetical protein
MSVSRQCYIALATDGKWYMQLGDFEYAFNACDCTWHGPFNSENETNEYLSDNFTNPGGCEVDERGLMAPPAECKPPESSRFW